MLSPGDTFGRYAIDAVLGEGGMGRVYRAEDTTLARRVALKILRADDADTKKRMLREARAAAALNHPNAVAVFDVGEIDGVPFLAMEYLEGKPLRAFVGDVWVPLGLRVRWLCDIARALGEAHRRGLVHRDVKPENVMITEAGAVKVLDFGIARRSVVDEAAKGAGAARAADDDGRDRRDAALHGARADAGRRSRRARRSVRVGRARVRAVDRRVPVALEREKEMSAVREPSRWSPVHFALLLGDLAEAERLLDAMLEKDAGAAADDLAAEDTRVLLEAELEAGVVANAKATAQRYLDGLPARLGNAAGLARPMALQLLRREHVLSEERSRVLRAELLREAQPNPLYAMITGKNALFYDLYASVAWTPNEAREALLALPEYSPLPKFVAYTVLSGPRDRYPARAMGMTYFLAGVTTRPSRISARGSPRATFSMRRSSICARASRSGKRSKQRATRPVRARSTDSSSTAGPRRSRGPSPWTRRARG